MHYLSVENLKAIVEGAIEKAERGETKLPTEILQLRGMSTPKIRTFLNEVCSHDYCTYIEIGTYSGSTLIPALYDNKVFGSLAIDDFSQFTPDQTVDGYDAKKELYENLQKYEKHIGRSGFWEGNAFLFPQAAVPKGNVYFYDGDHSALATQECIVKFGSKCYSPFILIVDDWELDPSVQEGTEKALVGVNVIQRWELKKEDGYHMGLGVFILEAK